LIQQNIEDTVSLKTSLQVGLCRNGNWGKGGWVLQVIFGALHWYNGRACFEKH
jgi:hypothetical protein